MKLILSIFLLLSFTQAFAQVALPDLKTPDQLYKLAQKSRFEFVDVIYEIRNSAMERRSIQDNLTYLEMLPNLKSIEVSLQYPEFGISPTTELAEYLTGCLASRFQLDYLSESQIELYINWGTDETIYTAIGTQMENILNDNRDLAGWDKFYSKAEALTHFISQRKVVSLMLKNTSEALQGKILSQYLYLFFNNISEASFVKKINNIESTETLDTILKFAAYDWGKLRNPDLKHKLFKVSLAVAKRMSDIHDDSSLQLTASLGETLLTQIMDLLQYNLIIDTNDILILSGFLTQKDWQNLIEFLTNLRAEQIAANTVPAVTDLLNKCLNLPQEWVFKESKIKLRSLIKQLAVAQISNKKLPEGLYSIQKGEETFYLWVLASTPWNMEAHLMTSYTDNISSFSCAEYSAEQNKVTFFSIDKEGRPEPSEAQLELSLATDANIGLNGAIVNDNGNQAVKVKYLQKLPAIEGVGPIAPSFSGLVGKLNYAIEVIQTGFATFDLTMKIAKTKSKLHFETKGSCFVASTYCDFVLKNPADNNWAFLRGALTPNNDFKGYLIQGTRVTPILLKGN
ncbi:MAG: hypothetical protein ACOYL6_03375 [Bacteriovoracaceae bacterium]